MAGNAAAHGGHPADRHAGLHRVAAGIAASAFGIAAAAPLGIYGVMVLVFGAIVVDLSRRR